MISKVLLFPYFIALKLRNALYDNGSLKARTHGVPVVSVGNITSGGTGKTPMVELLASLLKSDYRVAVISRGYKRKSRGFHIVSEDDGWQLAGDEPRQIKRKFPYVTVVVDKKRNRAIDNLMALPEEERPEVILLDDGFQYRKLKADTNILLVDYNRPVFKDELLPLGNLRDLPEQIRRADAIVFTKSPEMLDEWDRDKMISLTKVNPAQKVFFAKINYEAPAPVFPGAGNPRYIYSKEVFFFAGIADDKPVICHLSKDYPTIFHKKFGDHHRYGSAEARMLNSFAKQHPRTVLLTTEKDVQKLTGCKGLSKEVKERLFFLPITTRFLTYEEKDGFRDFIFSALPDKTPANGLLF